MKSKKFTAKMIRYNLILFSSILLVALVAFYFWVMRDTQRRAVEDFETLTEKAASQFDNLIYNMDKTALQIAANPNVVDWFGRIPREAGENYFEANPLVESDVVQLLNSFNFKKDGNSRICLYNNFGDFVYSATVMTTVEGIKQFFTSGSFWEVVEHFSGNNVFSMFRKPGPDVLNTSNLPSSDYFSIIREIKDYYTGTRKNGYVEIQQSVKRVDEIFEHLGESCYAAIYDQDGSIIYTTPGLKTHEEMLLVIQSILPEDYPIGASVDKGIYYSHFQMEEAPLDVMFFKEVRTVNATLNNFMLFLVLLFVAVSLVAVVSERMLITHLSMPLAELSRSVQNVNIDNLHLDLEDASDSDELQALNKVFNQVLHHLETAISQKVLSQTNELKSHVFALQAQMNPHFIYNTLAIINMEAEIDGNENTVQICQALSKMLKYSTTRGNGMATLAEELDHAKNYLELMQRRYEESFEFHIDADASLGNVQVSRLLIQPICENCFKHAFGNIEDVRRILVRSYRQGDRWLVRVEDNGCGFDPGFIEQFRKYKEKLSLETMEDRMDSLTLGGLCIENTCMRLYLLYGEDYVFELSNTDDGAVVTLGGKLSC